jgi:hypothetical protein
MCAECAKALPGKLDKLREQREKDMEMERKIWQERRERWGQGHDPKEARKPADGEQEEAARPGAAEAEGEQDDNPGAPPAADGTVSGCAPEGGNQTKGENRGEVVLGCANAPWKGGGGSSTAASAKTKRGVFSQMQGRGAAPRDRQPRVDEGGGDDGLQESRSDKEGHWKFGQR